MSFKNMPYIIKGMILGFISVFAASALSLLIYILFISEPFTLEIFLTLIISSFIGASIAGILIGGPIGFIYSKLRKNNKRRIMVDVVISFSILIIFIVSMVYILYFFFWTKPAIITNQLQYYEDFSGYNFLINYRIEKAGFEIVQDIGELESYIGQQSPGKTGFMYACKEIILIPEDNPNRSVYSFISDDNRSTVIKNICSTEMFRIYKGIDSIERTYLIETRNTANAPQYEKIHRAFGHHLVFLMCILAISGAICLIRKLSG